MPTIAWIFFAAAVLIDAPVATIEKVALGERLGLQSGQFDISSAHTFQAAKITIEAEYRIYFSGSKTRIDHIVQPHNGLPLETRKRVLTNEYFLDHIGGEASNGKKYAAVIAQNHGNADDVYAKRRKEVFDPRMIGIVPIDLGAIYAFTASSFLTRPDRETLSERDVVYMGVPARQVDFTLKQGDRVRIIIVPAFGNGVVEITLFAESNEGPYIDKCEIELKEWQESLWFPIKSDYTREFGGEIVERETLAFKNVALNEVVPDLVFAPEGLDLPAGTGFHEHQPRTGGARIWDGDKVRLLTNRDLATMSNQESGLEKKPRTFRWFIAVNLTVFLVAAGYLAFRKRADLFGRTSSDCDQAGS